MSDETEKMRAAFEADWEEHGDKEHPIWRDEHKRGRDYYDKYVDVMWLRWQRTWQVALSQTVPEGYKLVPDDLIIATKLSLQSAADESGDGWDRMVGKALGQDWDNLVPELAAPTADSEGV